MVKNSNRLNSVGVTTIIAIIGSDLYHVLALRAQASPCSMRQRQLSAAPSNSINTGKRIRSRSRLLGSPFDRCENEIKARTVGNAVDKISSTSKLNVANQNLPSINPTMTKNAMYTIGTLDTSIAAAADNVVIDEKLALNNVNSTMTTPLNNDLEERNITIPSPPLASEISTNSDEEMGRRLVTASQNPRRLFKDKIPSISVILLNLVAIIWGSQHAIIKTIVDDSDPAAFTFLRFGLASLIASPYLPGVEQTVQKAKNKVSSFDNEDINDDRKKNNINFWKSWRWGVEMGLWMFLGFSLQAIGLQTTTAQRSGFLLYLNCKFVPFFSRMFLGRQISKLTWVSAFAAFSGTGLLALDGQSMGLNVGDIWSVMAAAASAMFILRLEKASSEVPKSSELNSTSLAIVALLSGMWLLAGSDVEKIASDVTKIAFTHPLELVYLGAISTALANFIQAKAQKDIPAERATIIYSLDPVYGGFFSWIMLGETLGGVQAYIGASIIFAAAALNSLFEFSKVDETDK